MLLAPLLIASVNTRLSEGMNWTEQESFHFVSKESEIDETHRYKIDFRVTKRQDRFWVVERKSWLTGSRIADQELGPPPSPVPDISRQWFSDEGTLIDCEPFDRGIFSLDRLTTFWLPEGAGREWTAPLDTALTHFTIHSLATFRLVSGTEKGSRVYAMTFGPTVPGDAVTATGQLRFDVKTGRLVEAHIDAKNTFIPGGVDKANTTIVYTSQVS